jgi:hypothetical protein
VWGPAIDGVDVLGHPWELAQRGHHFKGPLLLGTARDEGVSFCGTPGSMTEPEFRAWAAGALHPQPLSKVVQMYEGHPNTTGNTGPWSWQPENHSEWYWASAKLVVRVRVQSRGTSLSISHTPYLSPYEIPS